MTSDLSGAAGKTDRMAFLPYGKQQIDEVDIAAVVEVLCSDWLTTGPRIEEFETAFARFVGAEHAVAVSSGTAALHASMHALGIGPGDEVIVPPMTFAATANCVLYQGGTPVFADVQPKTLLINPAEVEAKITPRTSAIIAVDYAGQPCDYTALRAIANRYGLTLVADACHAVGGSYHGRPVGSLADLSTFSFHPVKHFTTGEGGMITTDDAALAQKMRVFRNHGITSDHRQRAEKGSYFYEMVDLGYNYRITDIQCALGLSQLKKLAQWVLRRQEIARQYDQAFAKIQGIEPLEVQDNVSHAYHLYVIKIGGKIIDTSRDELFSALRGAGIGANVHYVPVHLHPYYRTHLGTGPGLCPVAEEAYIQVLSLPIFPAMRDEDVTFVTGCVCDYAARAEVESRQETV